MRVCLVGHGPSPVGQGWGWEIDRCDAVVRMWDCHWQDADDYGTRYDFGVFTVHANDLRTFRAHRRREPRIWLAYGLRDIAVGDLGRPVIRFAAGPYLARMGGARGASGKIEMSRGCVALCWAIAAKRPDRLIAVGFDAIRDGTLPADHYPAAFKACIAATGRAMNLAHLGPSTGSHVWSAERKLVEDVAAEHGTRLEWGFPVSALAQ